MNERRRSNALTVVAIERQACEVGGLAGFEGAELRHCDQQGKGGDVGYAGNVLIRMAKRSARLTFASIIWRTAASDRRDLAIDLFEALSILTFQQRERQSFSAVLWRRFDPSPRALRAT